MERDSTKGFVKYSMKFVKDFHKIKTKSKTSIFFDKNEPVVTNYAVTKFKPGISIGVKTGYNYYVEQENPKSFLLERQSHHTNLIVFIGNLKCISII